MAADQTSSFKTSKLNSSTFLITEHDSYGEHPFIYAKISPHEPLLILTDTGCDSPSKTSAGCRFIHLRDYLENCPIACNNDEPLNPGPDRRNYLIICSHCHYDHTLGLPQFQRPSDSTEIIASAQGRDFIQTNLAEHGLFDYLSIPVPEYKVMHWAQSYERLLSPGGKYLDIRLIATPGHTPDSLAWYDEVHRHLYVGDSLYEEGPNHDAPIIWPAHGNMIDWYYSMSKLLSFVRSQNAKASCSMAIHAATPEKGWISQLLHFVREENIHASRPVPAGSFAHGGQDVVEHRVRLGAGHQTSSADAEHLIEKALNFLGMVLRDEVPTEQVGSNGGNPINRWRLDGYGLHFVAPLDLVHTARDFFGDRYVV